jgi:hypothetical protein
MGQNTTGTELRDLRVGDTVLTPEPRTVADIARDHTFTKVAYTDGYTRSYDWRDMVEVRSDPYPYRLIQASRVRHSEPFPGAIFDPRY